MSFNPNHRFKLGKRIGGGAFGEIYEGTDQSGARVAVKLETVGCEYPQLQYEARIYNDLRSVEGIPRLLYSGREGEFNVMVMERLGADLESVLQSKSKCHLSTTSTMRIGVRALVILEQFHNHGFVHRDIKPDNLLLGFNDDSRLYLIDFGLSKYVRDSDGKHIPPNNRKRLTGTPRYASISNHKGRDQGRKDDLESLGFVLLYLLKGSLPWQDVSSDYDKIMEMKQSMLRSETLFRNTPSCFKQYFKYISTLEFSDRPDYDHMRGLLRRG
jgi:serine/threonine protein kinase